MKSCGGPGSVLYGTGAVSGVINLVGDSVEQPNEVAFEVGTFGEITTGAARVHQGNGTSGFRMSVAGATSPGRTVLLDPRGPETPALDINAFERFNAGTVTGRAWLGDFTAQVFHTIRAVDIPTGNFGTLLNVADGNRWTDQRTLVEARYEPQISESTKVLTRAYFNRYQFDGQSRYRVFASEEKYVGMSGGGEARVLFQPSDAFTLQVGGVGETAPVATLDGFDSYDNPDRPNEQWLTNSAPYTLAAGYAVAELVPIDALRLTAGARVDFWSTFGVAVSPRAALILAPGDRDVLKLMGGRAFRAPTYYELNYGDGVYQVPPDQAGFNLQPENVWSAEVEYSHAFNKSWTGLISGHGSQVNRLVEIAAARDVPGTFAFRNSGQPARLLGGDFELRRAFQGGFMVSGFYSFLDARFEDGERLTNTPAHNAAIKTVVPILRPTMRVALRTTLEAPRRINTRSQRNTGWHLVTDVVLSGELRDAGVEYSLGVYNVTDAAYALPVNEDVFQFATMLQRPLSVRARVSKSF